MTVGTYHTPSLLPTSKLHLRLKTDSTGYPSLATNTMLATMDLLGGALLIHLITIPSAMKMLLFLVPALH